jgi:hypothetical protein
MRLPHAPLAHHGAGPGLIDKITAVAKHTHHHHHTPAFRKSSSTLRPQRAFESCVATYFLQLQYQLDP